MSSRFLSVAKFRENMIAKGFDAERVEAIIECVKANSKRDWRNTDYAYPSLLCERLQRIDWETEGIYPIPLEVIENWHCGDGKMYTHYVDGELTIRRTDE